VLVPKLAPGPTPVPTPIPDKPASIPLTAPKEAPIEKTAPPAVKSETRQELDRRGRSGVRWWQFAGLAALLIALALGGIVVAPRYFVSPLPPVAMGTLAVTTNPTGAQVFVDGGVRGRSPVTLTLVPGAHVLELRGEGEPRSIPLTVNAGAQLAQYIELPRPTPPPEPPQPVVQAPPPPPPAPVAETAPQPGWIAISASIDLQLYEHDRLLGTSAIDRIMVPAGRHELDLVNNELGYRTTRVVQVTGGKIASIKAELPNGTIALNAVPWAEVWIDGQAVGETPIGNLAIPIGTHDVVFRHPDLGEQHYSQVVSLKGPARLSVDLRKK
jgi:hypothetical protein